MINNPKSSRKDVVETYQQRAPMARPRQVYAVARQTAHTPGLTPQLLAGDAARAEPCAPGARRGTARLPRVVMLGAAPRPEHIAQHR